ncbi:tyrosine-type recombinase/integrase [Pseudomonas viridiflava]|uniref:tyrosine-type recombinase/integrase n=1 Tax=Pseudomonas viridiflava TaxID=33069 RepID=UPI002EB10492|nr:tyrosine-type recombinase/integrase [Pseudomonas viridiflava]
MKDALRSIPFEKRVLQSEQFIHISLKGISDDIRATIKLSARSTFFSDVWDLSNEYPDLHPANVKLRISRIFFDDGTLITSVCKRHYLKSMLEYLYSMLVDPPSTRPKWSTVCATYHKGVARLLRYMEVHAFRKFSELGATDFEDFLNVVANETVKGSVVITDRALRARVCGLNWLFEQSSKLEDGLRSNPFGHYGSGGRWAIACCKKLIPRNGSTTVEMPDQVATAVFSCALKDLSIANNLHELNLERSRYVPRYRGTKKLLLNPFPWHQYGMKTGAEVVRWEARLATACYIVIAMLTGMRWHEIVSLRTAECGNWLEEEVLHDDIRRRFYFLISSTNKLQAVPVEYKWQTLPIVKLALSAAELGLARRRKAGTFLFPAYSTEGARTSDSASSQSFKRFVTTHCIIYQDKLWNLASHQFRKKFARIMTRQGLGIKALQDQLKHFDIEMTRGYSDMNLYVELQQEKFEVSKEHYEEIMHSQQRFIGGGGREMDQLQKQFLGMTKSQQKVFLDELPRSALIEQLDDGLCMYRSKHALCEGSVAACRPADCNNALITIEGKKKSFLWRKLENIRLINFFPNDLPKVAYLTARNAELDKLILQIDEVEDSQNER